MMPESATLIDRRSPPHSAIFDLIVFPSLEMTLAPRPLGHHRGLAQIHLKDGTIWMLVLPGGVWTPPRLSTAADVLSAISGKAYSRKITERQLSKVLALPSVRLVDPIIQDSDSHQWADEEIVQALSQNDESSRIRSRITQELRAALAEFAETLDPDARELSLANGRFDAALYNFLAYRPYRHYRQQFAAIFPGLLQTIVVGTRGTLGEELRAIVDEGAPVIKSLASRWNVRPGVVRHLIGRTHDQIGAEWSTEMKALATLLDSLRPQDLPKDDSESWRRFHHAVSVGQRIFGYPVWRDAAALRWFRECTYHINRPKARTESVWLPDDDTLREILRFKNDLTAALRRELVTTDTQTEARLLEALKAVIHLFLATYAHKSLGAIARRYDDGLRDLRQAPEKAASVAKAGALWPLIPDDFHSKDGSRVIVPLTTMSQLTTHGNSLIICLGGRTVERYLSKGRHGTRFIVGLLDSATGEPRSTAEVVARTNSHRVSYTLWVKQHTAKRNVKPSHACTTALNDLLAYCRTPKISRHLQKGWDLIADRKRLDSRRRAEQLDRWSTEAMRLAIGDQEFQALLRQVREAMERSPPESNHIG